MVTLPERVFFMRTIVLIDGQNLYHLAKKAWSDDSASHSSPYVWPSYDVVKLARSLVNRLPGRILAETRFYTGVPNPVAGITQKFWHGFWTSKLRDMKSKGVYVYRGRINAGGQEKGVDVSLALDLIRATYEKRFEAAIIVSRDSDFGPAVRMSKDIARMQNRKLRFESSFPIESGSSSVRGIPGTVWVPIDKATYDACLDLTDFRTPSG